MPVYARVIAAPGAALLELAARSARSIGAMAEGARLSERDVVPHVTRGADWATLAAMGEAVGLGQRDLMGRAAMTMRSVMEDEEPDGRYPFVMSDAQPDRARDIVQQDWDLREFESNPVALWAHDYSQPAVGTWEGVQVRDGRLQGVVVPYPTASYPLSVTVAEQLRAGVLRTCSVGFVPSNVQWRGSDTLKGSDLYDERGGLVFMAPRLMECSLTPQPMNPRAEAQRSIPLTPAETVRAAVDGLRAAASAPRHTPSLDPLRAAAQSLTTGR
jgi:phage head maturation protease